MNQFRFVLGRGFNFVLEKSSSLLHYNKQHCFHEKIRYDAFSAIANNQGADSHYQHSKVSGKCNRQEKQSSSLLHNTTWRSHCLVKSNFQNINKHTIQKVLRMSSSSSSSISNEDARLREKFKPRERTVKTPFGQLGALEWGSVDAPCKILCVHGWLDNAGSFERLVPFILNHGDNANKYHIVSMDHPGVGHSSHRPPGADYNQFSLVMEMRRMTQHLKWDQVTLLTHSYGSHTSYLYSCVYPKQVANMISIDLAHPITRQIKSWNLSIANSIEDFFKCEYTHDDDPITNLRVPVYSEVDAIKRLMDSHSNSLTRESAEVLLKRGAKKQSWGYTFSRDIRLRHMSLEFKPDDDAMLQYLTEFKASLLIIRAKQSPYHRPEEVRIKYYDLYKKNCPVFKDVMMDGTHHLHMNNPDTVAIEINKFLEEVGELAKANRGKSNL